MTKAKAAKEKNEAPLEVTGRFFTCVKTSHLLYMPCEIEVVKGMVTSFKLIARAPDMAQSACGVVSREVWRALREQTLESVCEGAKIGTAT